MRKTEHFNLQQDRSCDIIEWHEVRRITVVDDLTFRKRLLILLGKYKRHPNYYVLTVDIRLKEGQQIYINDILILSNSSQWVVTSFRDGLYRMANFSQIIDPVEYTGKAYIMGHSVSERAQNPYQFIYKRQQPSPEFQGGYYDDMVE